MSPSWDDKIKKRNSTLRSPTEQAVFPMGTPETETPKEQNSKNAKEQTVADAKQQNSKSAEKQNFVLANEQTSASAEKQTSVDAKEQNNKSTKEQNNKYANLRRITFHIPEELFRKLKLIAIEEDLTMLEIGAQMAQEYIDRKRQS